MGGSLEGRSLWSENADVGVSVYGESLRKFSAELSTEDGIQLAQIGCCDYANQAG